MFEFLGNLFQQLIEIAQLVINYITQGLPGGTPECPEMPEGAFAGDDATCGTEEW
ncbi:MULTISPECIES: hypothetical protein [Corynebacterium]|uniref:hypothetical protein n=1 Tax=Corynebacterium TaxID=1716 RepID=UPI001642AA1A|nr:MULTISPECIES: hypothetical protein [Corynebacterium]